MTSNTRVIIVENDKEHINILTSLLAELWIESIEVAEYLDTAKKLCENILDTPDGTIIILDREFRTSRTTSILELSRDKSGRCTEFIEYLRDIPGVVSSQNLTILLNSSSEDHNLEVKEREEKNHSNNAKFTFKVTNKDEGEIRNEIQAVLSLMWEEQSA